MKGYLKKVGLSISAALGGLVAGCVFWQKYCFWQAKNKADTKEYEVFQSVLGDIAYTKQGHGRPLLLIHSMFLGTNRKEWDKVVDSLAQRNEVYAIDLPGFGDSFYPDAPWTAYDYGNCIHAFLEKVICRPVFILAANGGADMALIVSMLHPEKIEGMILVSPEGIGEGFATKESISPLKKLCFPLTGTQFFLMETRKRKMGNYLETLFFAKETISKEMIQAHSRNARSNTKAQVTFASLATGLWRADTKHALATAKVPIWMIWGEENKGNPIAYMDQGKDLCPQGNFVVFEETAAFPHIENSEAFCSIVEESLN